MACEFPVAVKAKLMLTAIHCLLTYFYILVTEGQFLVLTGGETGFDVVPRNRQTWS